MLKIILLLIIAAIIACYYSFTYIRYYNGKINSNFDGTRFYDPVSNQDKTFFDVLKWRIKKKPAPWPLHVANNQFDIPPERVVGDDLRVSYVGHVTFLIQTQGVNILTDPVWSERASPVSFAGPKRVQEPGIKFENLPPIDFVWISHNHYDHLDLATIDRLWEKHKPRIITPLGNDTIIKNHNPYIIVEVYDWGDEVVINDKVKFHIDPMQHWSARNFFDKNKALWAALTIETAGGNIYFIGDSGYGEGRYFKKAKEKFGKFRLALLPIGAYEPRWFMKYAHMEPEETSRAYIDLGMPNTIPSHYDVFQLTDEPRGEALDHLQKAIKQLSLEDRSFKDNFQVLEVGQFWMVPKDGEKNINY